MNFIPIFKKITVLIAFLGLMASCTQSINNTSTPKTTLAKGDSLSKIEVLIKHLENPQDSHIMVIAHRGDWRNFPENSIAAIESSIAMGADMVEIDVRMTTDSVLVLMHDETLERTTNGQGNIWEISYDSLRKLSLKNGLMQTTPHKVPTLEEALLASKGKILINIDTKDYKNLSKYYELLKRTETLNQVVIKAPIGKATADSIFGNYLNDLYFMPLVRSYESGAVEMVAEYQKKNPPVAFEFTFPSDTVQLFGQLGEIREKGSRIWVNSLRPHHCVNMDDEKAAFDITTYDWFINNRVNMIQTDRPKLLLDYLRSKGLHD